MLFNTFDFALGITQDPPEMANSAATLSGPSYATLNGTPAVCATCAAAQCREGSTADKPGSRCHPAARQQVGPLGQSLFG